MRAIALLPLALLAACGGTDDTTGVSSDEAAQLNAAADLLDANAAEPAPETTPPTG
ncbi:MULTISPECIES: hypothetical protein [unclassified Sphingomonas]|uniref:hypothetical protein n=1 Tax=unclassified Sphingomonas TaxID=196159 RepID=UPI0021517A14|nr:MULTISPECIES: hypothetical protein [unclassified Sphingomonas]MCR5871639.1 hypothetical protein [Sphingomonas sp. J344]UUY00069.1 hypothetical protein LRS08_02730 [Sphingomonas sp. J315]